MVGLAGVDFFVDFAPVLAAALGFFAESELCAELLVEATQSAAHADKSKRAAPAPARRKDAREFTGRQGGWEAGRLASIGM